MADNKRQPKPQGDDIDIRVDLKDEAQVRDIIGKLIQTLPTAAAEEQAKRKRQAEHLAQAVPAYAAEQRSLRDQLADPPKPPSPYKSLHYFNPLDKAIFFGRNTVADELVERILRPDSRLTVLHAPSGAGKTSLIRAGLIPRLLGRGCYTLWATPLPYPGSVYAPISEVVSLGPDFADLGMRDFFGVVATALSLPKGCALVVFLDQFERLFGREGEGVLDAVERDLAACARADDSALPLRLVVSIRTDFAAHLDRFRKSLPKVLDHREMLDPLTKEQALAAITGPVKGWPVSWEPDATQAVLDYLAKGVIEPPHLQLICSQLYEKAEKAGQPAITCADAAEHDLAALHREYLQKEMRGLVNEELGWAALKQLVTSHGIAQPRLLDEIQESLGEGVDRVVEALVDRRVLRQEMVRGGVQAEIAHETLAQEILAHESPEEIRKKAARELITRGLDDWKGHGTLLDRARLRILDEYRDVLEPPILGEGSREQKALEFLFRSALVAEHEVPYWRERAPVIVGKIENKLFDGLGSPDPEQAKQTISHLTALASPSIVGRLGDVVRADFRDEPVTWVDHLGQEQEVLRTALNLVTPRQRRAVAVLARMELPEATDILRGWTPPGMILVPAGPFTMGSTEESDEGPVHEVWLVAFWIERYPATNAQWAVFLTGGGWERRELWTEAGWKWKQDEKPASGDRSKPDHPMVEVNRYEALAYARWGRRILLSEAQWEKAASWDETLRKKRRYPWGDEFDKEKCNTRESNIGKTTMVGKYSPEGDSPYGCADMAGNVWEWCSNLKIPYPYNPDDGREESEGTGSRVLRGGSFNLDASSARCACRFFDDFPDSRYGYSGFRCGLGASPISPRSGS